MVNNNSRHQATSKLPKKQHTQPGIESNMRLKPIYKKSSSNKANKLQNKVAIITGGDSGIGRAIAILFADHGADIVIAYLNEHEDANKIKAEIEARGRKCLLLPGDLRKEKFCHKVIEKTMQHFGKINILINNAAEQHPQDEVEAILSKDMVSTFQTNVFAYMYMIQAALPHLKKGSTIINTTSVTGYRGSHHLVDYAATKGAIVALTRSLSSSLIKRGIRVNGVAPGPIWTPLIPATFTQKEMKSFGKKTPMGRAGQPYEVAPCYLFLASADSSYMSGQFLHPNGGEIING